MLELRSIVKDYHAGGSAVRALSGVSLKFRRSEFVSILGPSGCGKTTLLNIIGGLDQYTSGDLIIRGVSTKRYTDADWDTYRNHSIGFVFQNYNLIPHQSILANVELALTLSGISRRERRRRATETLRQVGLGNQLHKRPNQMSGGQMQRVAIARALVNNPDIILADEPTGALDTQTSIQIMELLKRISKRKLIIMVTHNPELASQYSNRIIRVVDGKVVDDSHPYRGGEEEPRRSDRRKPKRKRPRFAITARDAEELQLGGTGFRYASRKGKRSMSFFTALSLSLNNLMTKKARTFMTSFAGSIGIIGIALILSVSTGVNNYINAVQRDTLASYPIQLLSETTDLSSLVSTLMQQNETGEEKHELDRVYENSVLFELMNSVNSAETTTNDLKAFKKHLEENEELRSYLTAVQYTYRFHWNILTKDADDRVVKSDITELFAAMSSDQGQQMTSSGSMSAMTATFNIWQEMLSGMDGETVSGIIKDSYDLIYGEWPTAYNEVMLVVDGNNEISDLALYALGLRTEQEILDTMMAASKGELPEDDEIASWSYEEICDMNFRLLLQSESYQKQTDGTYADMTESDHGLAYLYNNANLGVDLKVVGILRPNPDATSAILTGAIAYTSALTDYAVQKTAESTLLRDQLANPDVDVLTGLPFKGEDEKELTDAEKRAEVERYLATLTLAEKAFLYKTIAATPTEQQVNEAVAGMMAAAPDLKAVVVQALIHQNFDEETARSYVDSMSQELLQKTASEVFAAQYTLQYQTQMEGLLATKNDQEIVGMLEMTLGTLDDAGFAALYDTYLPKSHSESTLEENLELLGHVEKDSPDGINLYAATFEDKDEISRLISEYNDGVEESQKISYTDYIALLMSSITTIVNAITYVLIAFVAISLVVSSIMIGIITYISVLERTKEIGILRAIGASKRDIGRVFNAETLIVGFVAGALGIVVTLGLNVIINIILFQLTGIATLKAVLPTAGAILLVVISMLLTFVAGLFPAKVASNRNPVEALRSE